MQRNSFDVLNEKDKVVGGMDGGYQEEPTNLREQLTKGGSLPMFCIKGCTQTIVHTLDPLIILGIRNNMSNNNIFNNRCRLEIIDN